MLKCLSSEIRRFCLKETISILVSYYYLILQETAKITNRIQSGNPSKKYIQK